MTSQNQKFLLYNDEEAEDSGVFHMNLADFCKYFKEVIICKYKKGFSFQSTHITGKKKTLVRIISYTSENTVSL